MEEPGDVRLSGHLRAQKSRRVRFFVLRAPSARGPARLESYESRQQFAAGGPPPKPGFPLAGTLSIGKRADARHRHLVLLYGPDRTLGLAAGSPEEQEAWYRALLELRGKGPAPPPFREVWQVTLRPKGLARAGHLAGVHRLCLGEGAVQLLRPGAPAPSLALPLGSVRRCGHADGCFFLEVGRAAATGPGELWMQADDAPTARHIHATLLEAMTGRGGGRRPPAPPAPGGRPPAGYVPMAPGDYVRMGPRGPGVGPGEPGEYVRLADRPGGREPPGLNYVALDLAPGGGGPPAGGGPGPPAYASVDFRRGPGRRDGPAC